MSKTKQAIPVVVPDAVLRHVPGTGSVEYAQWAGYSLLRVGLVTVVWESAPLVLGPVVLGSGWKKRIRANEPVLCEEKPGERAAESVRNIVHAVESDVPYAMIHQDMLEPVRWSLKQPQMGHGRIYLSPDWCVLGFSALAWSRRRVGTARPRRLSSLKAVQLAYRLSGCSDCLQIRQVAQTGDVKAFDVYRVLGDDFRGWVVEQGFTSSSFYSLDHFAKDAEPITYEPPKVKELDEMIRENRTSGLRQLVRTVRVGTVQFDPAYIKVFPRKGTTRLSGPLVTLESIQGGPRFGDTWWLMGLTKG